MTVAVMEGERPVVKEEAGMAAASVEAEEMEAGVTAVVVKAVAAVRAEAETRARRRPALAAERLDTSRPTVPTRTSLARAVVKRATARPTAPREVESMW